MKHTLLALSAALVLSTSAFADPVKTNADLNCVEAGPSIAEASSFLRMHPDNKPMFLDGEEAQVYIAVINADEPVTAYDGEFVFGIEHPDGSAMIAFISKDQKTLCGLLNINQRLQSRALQAAKTGV